jgi:hypothetical protein
MSADEDASEEPPLADISDHATNATSRSAAHNDSLQLRRAISIQAEGKKLLEKHAIAVSCKALLGVPIS